MDHDPMGGDGDGRSRSLCEQFHTDGYVVIPNLLSSQHLNEWQSIVGGGCGDGDEHGGVGNHHHDKDDNDTLPDILTWLHHELYQQGHTPFAQDSREIPTTAGGAVAVAGGGTMVENDKDKKEDDMQKKKNKTCTTTTTTTEREYAMKQGVKNGFREIVMRSPGRYEISLMNINNNNINNNNNKNHHHHPRDNNNKHHTTETPADFLLSLRQEQQEKQQQKQQSTMHTSSSPMYSSSMLLERLYTELQDHYHHDQQQQLIPGFLSQSSWSTIRIINVSLVIATPGAPTQGWHVDGCHVNVQQYVPCHCLNVFIALHDIPNILYGPTQIRPGTHIHTRKLVPFLLAAKCRNTLQIPITPLLHAGDALIFDYRILHRGLANQQTNNNKQRQQLQKDNLPSGTGDSSSSSSDNDMSISKNRTMLVITVAQDWFQDRLNFPSRSLFASSC